MQLLTTPPRRAGALIWPALSLTALCALPTPRAHAAPSRLYISPNGFQIETMPGFSRTRVPQGSKSIEAAWNGPRRATLVRGTGPIPANMTSAQLLQAARGAFPRYYGKNAKIVHAEAATANGNRGAIVEGRSLSTLRPIIRTHTIQCSIARGTKLYVFSLAVPAGEAAAAGTRFGNMLKTLRFR